MKFYASNIFKWKLISLCLLLLTHKVIAIDNPLLAYVPADTLLFSGNTELVTLSDHPLVSLSLSPLEPLSSPKKQQLGKAGRFFYELYMDLQQTVNAASTEAMDSVFKNHYGLSEQFAMVFYTQGISPVIKLTLENEQNLLQLLDQASRNSGLSYQSKHFKQQVFRSYPLADGLQFIVSVSDPINNLSVKTVTLALLPDRLSEQELSLILGLTQPQPSLATTDKLANIIQQNNYLPISVSFIDFEQMLGSFYSHKKPSIAALIDHDNKLSAWQTLDCQQDMLDLIKELPRLTAGYTYWYSPDKLQSDNSRLKNELKVLLEINNQNVKLQLNRFRGFIPDYVKTGTGQNIFAFALGTNLAQLSPMFFYISQAFKNTHFKCKPLLKLQAKVAKTNPAMVALMTGVFDGIHGIAFALQKFSLPERPDNQGADNSSGSSFIFSITSEYPQQIWRIISGFDSAMASITPSEQPQPVHFSLLESMGITSYLAIKGEHLVLYSGQPAQQLVQNLAQQAISTNGLIYESINYTRLAQAGKQLKQSIKNSDNMPDMPAENCIYLDTTLAKLSRMAGTMVYESDFTERGWLHSIKADIAVSPPLKPGLQVAGNYQTFSVTDGCQLARDGKEQINADGTGLYQKYSDDGQCFIFETRYRWSRLNGKIQFQYLSEHARSQGLCQQAFEPWAIPQAEYINDSCTLITDQDGDFSCIYHWDGAFNKTVYKKRPAIEQINTVNNRLDKPANNSVDKPVNKPVIP